MGLGGTWNGGNPITAIGDNRWLDYRASVDVSFENGGLGTNNYAALGARQQGGSESHDLKGTPYALRFWYDGGWQLAVNGGAVASGNVAGGMGPQVSGFDGTVGAWHNLALRVVGNEITAYVDDVEVAQFTDPQPRLSGRVDLASGYFFTRFDNLRVEKVAGAPAHYAKMLDDLEMNDLADPPSSELVYGGDWAHENGKSMYNYQRSLSTNQGSNATLTYAFSGTGLDILGPNDGSARLEVQVDGQVVDASASTMASGDLYQTFTLRGLDPGEHTVELRVLSGTLVVDAVGVVP